MERIKQAIENAKKPGPVRAGRPDASHVHSHYTRSSNESFIHSRVRWDVVKYVTAAVLIFLAGWLWLRLDFMNQLELIASEYINDGVKQARAEVKRRFDEEARFKQLIQTNLAHCQEAAEKNKDSYMKLAQETVRAKNEKLPPAKHEKFILPHESINEANRMMETAKAECQNIYDTQLKAGR
jgi:hypothetical protein